jgi:hypothetical protein
MPTLEQLYEIIINRRYPTQTIGIWGFGTIASEWHCYPWKTEKQVVLVV